MLAAISTMRRNTSISYGTCLLVIVVATGFVHVAVLLMATHNLIASNIIQLFSVLTAALVCIFQAKESMGGVASRRLWHRLAFAFLVWSLGQALFLLSVFLSAKPARSPNSSDVAWLAFAFPLLLVAARRDSKEDIVSWLDTAQSAAFFIILFILVFHQPTSLSMVTAYNVQSVAMVLACALRYSTTHVGSERIFFRNLLLYSLAYGFFSAIGYAGQGFGFGLGSLIDICWPLPFLIFSVLTLVCPPSAALGDDYIIRDSARHHLQGISALGLAAMSMLASVALAHTHPALCGTAVVITSLLFAARTTAREWQLRRAQEGLRHASLHDSLTGLPNRAFLQQALTKHLECDGKGCNGELVIILFDLDRFKLLNEGWGREIGNKVLVLVSERVQQAVRSQDLLVRYGGDEFAVLLANVEQCEAGVIAARLIEAIRSPLLIDGKYLYVTASAGVAGGSPGSDAETMMRDADCAMYKAKLAGKDRFMRFASAMRDAANRKLRIELALRDALAAEALTVHYQPIYGLSETALVGFEALVRWTDAELGVISPAEFIPVAEDMGLITPLGEFVLRVACRQVSSWNALHGQQLFISINLSARQFDAPDLFATIASTLQESGLPPALLKLEITESVLLDGQHSVSEVLSRLRATGIQISLDDFGTGYSSLSYLLRYEFDVIKVDQSFVRNLDQDPVRGELVRTVVHLAHNLGKKVVAEGVELPSELEYLRELECHMVQGYLLSKPLPCSLIDALLDNLNTADTRMALMRRLCA
ncbi:putative bifunctional diguanylate cyclase/phosphodiesterase [Granulicella aggregans]|nr:bifunctional diguanylate cyclase/phosphodiesterase [Granulicella aggregans]